MYVANIYAQVYIFLSQGNIDAPLSDGNCYNPYINTGEQCI